MTVQGIYVDLWRHSFDFYKDLFTRTWRPSEVFQQSMFLDILQNCEILYDTDFTFQSLLSKANNWEWPMDCIDHLLEKRRRAKEFNQGQELDEFERILFTRKMVTGSQVHTTLLVRMNVKVSTAILITSVRWRDGDYDMV